jgi:hypothetical protein
VRIRLLPSSPTGSTSLQEAEQCPRLTAGRCVPSRRTARFRERVGALSGGIAQYAYYLIPEPRLMRLGTWKLLELSSMSSNGLIRESRETTDGDADQALDSAPSTGQIPAPTRDVSRRTLRRFRSTDAWGRPEQRSHRSNRNTGKDAPRLGPRTNCLLISRFSVRVRGGSLKRLFDLKTAARTHK